MSSPADRFTRLQKIAVFLIAMGEERAREILADMDMQALEQIHAAMSELGEITPKEKAAVMIEFGDFFYKGKPLSSKLPGAGGTGRGKKARSQSGGPKTPAPPPAAAPKSEEEAATAALEKLRERAEAGQIDWSRAGYDFGEGFKGLGDSRRR